MCLMNPSPDSIGELDGRTLAERSEAPTSEPKRKVDYVLANPPFGKKSSMTFTNEEATRTSTPRPTNDKTLWETTSNKQPNFLQDIVSMLSRMGIAAVVLPDVLFEGARAKKFAASCWKTARHTVRAAQGILDAQGVKAKCWSSDAKPRTAKFTPRCVWLTTCAPTGIYVKTWTLKL